MKKINELRKLLLKNKIINNEPDRLTVFAADGNFEGDAPSFFQTDYDAIVVITEFSGDALEVLFPIREWYLINQSDKAVNSIKWKVELLDNEGVDLEIKIPLCETYNINKATEGTELKTCSDALPDVPEITELFVNDILILPPSTE